METSAEAGVAGKPRRRDIFRLKKVQGCSFWSLMSRCDSTAPTMESEASTPTTNCRLGSGWERMGAEVKKDFNLVKAASA